MTTAADVRFDEGFHAEEIENGQPFRWMSDRGVLTFAPEAADRFLELWALSEFHDLSQRLVIGTEKDSSYPLVHGWSPLSIVVTAHRDRLPLHASALLPRALHPADARTLSVRLRDIRLHRDPDRHGFVERQHRNAVLNVRETLERSTLLASTPPSLGIDLYGVCNVKPPCVYCEWDSSKALEGDHVDTPFTRETLEEWGPFFDNAVHLVNCSIGEPFMMRNIDELLDIFGNTGKVLEMTTNGQILTDRNIQKLVDRHIDAYISLDAATPLTYSRLRNDTFEKIVANIRRLVDAKGGRGRWPHVYLVFMPMRCNVHELDDFVRLCADLKVDRMVLRPLNYSPSIGLDWNRAGYHFSYQDELLPFAELVRASGRAARMARELGVELSDQMDFGGAMRELFEDEFARGAGLDEMHAPTDNPQSPVDLKSTINPQSAIRNPQSDALPSLGAEGQPACLEPWKSLYILRRGVMPCCYGAEPVASMDDYRSAWNSPTMQAIRGELLEGRFHDYCLRSITCPIVRKLDRAKTLPRRQRWHLKAREWWARIDRRLGGVPNRIWRPLKGAIAIGDVRP